MKTESIKKLEVLSNSNSIKFKEEVNNLFESLKDSKDVEVQFAATGKGHNAYVTWTEDKLIPEDIRDEFILRGEKHYCGECPHWAGNKPCLDSNGVRDVSSCGMKIITKPLRYCSSACLWLYQELAKGEIVLYELPRMD